MTLALWWLGAARIFPIDRQDHADNIVTIQSQSKKTNPVKRISKIFCFSVALVLLGSLSAAAQVAIFSESFGPAGPLTVGSVIQYSYVYGDANFSTSSSGVVAGNGVSGTASWRIFLDAPSGGLGYSGVGAYYEWNTANGNTSTSLSDYTLSFDARADAENLSFGIEIRTWPDPNNGGTQTGTLTTGAVNPIKRPLHTTYTHYDLNLGDTNIFSVGTIEPSGDTIRVYMQLDGGGITPYDRILYIDNFTLTLVPEPSSLALCAIGAVVGGIAFLRRRHA